MISPRGLEWLLLTAVVLYALQATYSADFSKALENMVFFYVPFALLFALLREVEWTRELLLQCLAVAVALAVVFVGVGFIEYDRKQLFLNPKVVAADQYGNYFRVNSLFFDPNIYGRFLALVMIGVTTAVLWSVRRREVLLGGAVLLWLLAGLVTSFSQSSIAALLLGLAVLAAYRWDVRGTIYVTVALAAIALVVVAVAPPSLHLGLTGKGGSASNATSGRTKLIEGGLRLFADRPLQGFGPGSFAPEYRAHEHVTSNSATSASHTIPDHGRGRAGDRRPCAVRGAAGGRPSRCCSAGRAARRQGSHWRPVSRRWCCTPSPTPTSSRTRRRGCCWGSGWRSPTRQAAVSRRSDRNGARSPASSRRR